LTSTDLHHFLRTRRTIRRFKADAVTDSVIERILTTAACAPSAHDLQPWRFCVVTTSVVKNKLGAALTSKMRADMQAEDAPELEIEKRVANSLRRINEAPVILLLCRDVTAVRADTPEETIMATQSVAAAGLQLLLAAHAEELGGNWICWPLYAQEETRAALELPATWEPQAMFFIGYADQEPKTKALKLMDDLVKTL
jgi:F420 biosynthesis protein FbiB-like protein